MGACKGTTRAERETLNYSTVLVPVIITYHYFIVVKHTSTRVINLG